MSKTGFYLMMMAAGAALCGCSRQEPPPPPMAPAQSAIEERMSDPQYRADLKASQQRQNEIRRAGGPDMQKKLEAELARARALVSEKLNKISK